MTDPDLRIVRRSRQGRCVDWSPMPLREGSTMPSSRIQLAPGTYDLLLNGEVVGSMVRNSS